MGVGGRDRGEGKRGGGESEEEREVGRVEREE